MKKALITGVTGQDGSYLTEFLLEKGYEVWGVQRRASTFNTVRINHLYDRPGYEKFDTIYGDLTDSSSLSRIVDKIKPDEIYNLGAQSHVGVSFLIPEYTGDVTGLGALRLLDAIKETGVKTKFYQASSSELFGGMTDNKPLTEESPINPKSPYGCAKAFAYWITRNYRDSYGIFACNGILFNHESPRRGETFVTRKITRGLARIKLGLERNVAIGNLDAKRDWGYAPEYVEAMWLMLQQEKPDDYIIATGEAHSVREFAEEAARLHGYEIVWEGSELEEKGIDKKTGQVLIIKNPRYFRPMEIDCLFGDYSKAKEKFGWEPKIKFKKLVEIMVKHDYNDEKKVNNIT